MVQWPQDHQQVIAALFCDVMLRVFEEHEDGEHEVQQEVSFSPLNASGQPGMCASPFLLEFEQSVMFLEPLISAEAFFDEWNRHGKSMQSFCYFPRSRRRVCAS